MDLTRRSALTTLAASALVISGRMVDVDAQPADSDSVITNGISGFDIRENGHDDFSLKLISGDGTKDVTFVRYKGSTAYADCVRIQSLLKSLTELMGLDT